MNELAETEYNLDDVASRPSEAAPRIPTLDWLPAALAAFGAVVAVGGNQGAYFPTAWGPSSVGLLALIAAFLILGVATDASRADAAFALTLATLIGWIALSGIWSAIPTETLHEVQRGLVFLAGVVAILLLSRGGTHAHIAFAIAAGIVVLCGYALATRLLPATLGTFDSTKGYRLAEPIGYWNGLGILAAIGILLLLALSLESRSNWEQAAAAVALCVVAPTLYFTYSRGAWVALLVGLMGTFAVSPRRLRSLAGLLCVAPAPVAIVLFASTLDGLTTAGVTLDHAVSDGRTMIAALSVGILVAVAGSTAWLALQKRGPVGQPTRVIAGALVLGALCISAVGAVVHEGGPSSLASRAKSAFNAPEGTAAGPRLNGRLFVLSGTGRSELWQVAREAWESSPLLGVGAGSYERYWQASDRWSHSARDAHSLYLETLTELGPLGLLLLALTLGIPVYALVSARRQPVISGALGAFIAYLVHAGIDWDWELTVVTLSALLVGCLGLIALRTGLPSRLGGTTRLVAGIVLVAAAGFVTVGYIGNDSLDRAQVALDIGNAQVAVSESRYGDRWSPWSPYPATVRGEAFLLLNQDGAARAAFLRAIDRDPRYWRAWLGLAVASNGAERAAAMRRAKVLFPRSREIEETERLLAERTVESAEG